MRLNLLQLITVWWSAAYIVIIGAWKTTEFVRLMSVNSHDLLLAGIAGLLFFGPFIAAELDLSKDDPSSSRSPKSFCLYIFCSLSSSNR